MARLEFGPFELDTRRQVLLRGGEHVSLTPKALAVLTALVERAGELLDKDRLMDAAWADQYVGENVLSQNIYTLRQLFAREDPETSYIETIPRRGYRFVAGVEARERASTEILSLAVLPFDASPATPESEALGLAMADSMTTQLSRLDRLQVRPTSSVRDVAGRERSLEETGRKLGVQAIATGLVQEAGTRLRINCQLVELGSGETRWAESIDTNIEAVFEAQDRLAASLAETLLPTQPIATFTRPTPRTANPEAYRAYVRGRFSWNGRTGEGLEAAIGHFKAAIDLDPGYAPAHAGLADAYVLLPFYGGAPPIVAFPKAKLAALDSLRLDPHSAAAHTALAYARFLFDWNWAEAERAFEKAISEDPGYANAHHWYGFMLAALGRHKEAIASSQRAAELDPLSLVINADLGFVYYFGGSLEQARQQFEHTLELAESFTYARFGLSLVLEQLGRGDEALQQARIAYEQASDNLALVAAYARALALTGQTVEAEQFLERMTQTADTKAVYRAFVLTGLGRDEEALDALELACKERSRFVVFLRVWPIYDGLRGNSRFETLSRRVGFPNETS